ncbi:hypothetical protein MKZ38_000036 [Zalerion maritima]|uniref:Uncharacterized protein n=1 Tax=Zalerion maritima TaxID=339359 RepID=A0AAD5RST7_9PEZI|nr:hypothetical protein MKZ38_000036 [Zalerion maritima]
MSTGSHLHGLGPIFNIGLSMIAFFPNTVPCIIAFILFFQATDFISTIISTVLVSVLKVKELLKRPASQDRHTLIVSLIQAYSRSTELVAKNNNIVPGK